MDTKEIIKEIKTQLRLSMNGVASQSMREKGLAYKINFGVELPRLKEIAKQYDQIMIWRRLSGKRMFVNRRFLPVCYSPLILSSLKLQIFG